jgi:hypothetical protein
MDAEGVMLWDVALFSGGERGVRRGMVLGYTVNDDTGIG